MEKLTMMRWIKIEPGCEMPEEGERVLVVAPNGWEEAEWTGSYFSVAGCDEEMHGITDWLRVELP